MKRDYIAEVDAGHWAGDVGVFQNRQTKNIPYHLTTLSMLLVVFGLAFMGFGPRSRYQGTLEAGPKFVLAGIFLCLAGGIVWGIGKGIARRRKKFLAKFPFGDSLIFTPEGIIHRHFQKVDVIAWDQVTDLYCRILRRDRRETRMEVLKFRKKNGKTGILFLHQFAGVPDDPAKKADFVADYAKKYAHRCFAVPTHDPLRGQGL